MTATDTYLLLRAFCDELARAGVAHVATSPGSRSTPLVLSLVREPRLRAWSHVDERSAAFFALGVAKATGLPSAIVCTSGTAAANYLPAVIEAHEARVPLIVLTADRPPELRDNGAGQTIDQLKLYGSAVKWFVEVGSHEWSRERERWIRTLASRAVLTALEGRPGPVHLNFPLREPLVLDAPLPAAAGGRPDGAPWVSSTPPAGNPPAATLSGTRRGVIVAGREERGAWRGVGALAEGLGWPVLADPLSGARRGAAAIAHYDALLRDEAWGAAHAPEVVLRVGDLPTSKSLRTWLAGLDAEQIAVDPEGAWQDPAGVVSRRLDNLPVRAGAADPDWLYAWRAADRVVVEALEAAVGADLTEPRVAVELGARLPSAATLVVASSMPVRDVETFFPLRPDPPRVLSNRGANGIDGTVSTAFGVAATATPEERTVLLIGDVALAHDIGGLLAARRLSLDLTIVLLNNDGGGIFHFLPVAGETDAFEQHVATPHGLDFAHAAALYGCDHERVEDLGSFRTALDAALATPGASIVEVPTERVANVEAHRRAWEAVRAALSAA
ncbi:MAG: 2-succinyl-6-hydroxy-2,4-cyclohexadiene-carboxylic acid synthase/2-oxoglutarate decarboxylase [Solirubrobacterales bacterium]|nr:2-succinyl-6-hydroxy-2,4-cyclohexadiene-carboxylic acid synthase/2-oxoglutarate decarboxylase [Solirubrobacterales bacterium]